MSQPLQTMVSGQLKPNRVNDPRVLQAFEDIPREAFVPGSRREVAYVDEDIQIAPGRYVMEPMILGRLIAAAAVKKEDIVLDVACGAGYSTAILSRLATVVVGIEEDEALVERASETLADLDIDTAAVIVRNLTEGCPKQGPFNVIVVAGAVDFIPQRLFDQLADGGRLVTILKENGVGRGTVFTKNGAKVTSKALFDAHVPDLPGFQNPTGFKF